MNKKLKDKIDVTIKQNNVAKDMFIKKCDNCIKLQKRIDKAIEYIDNELLPFENYWHWDNAGIEDLVVELITKLRGEDNTTPQVSSIKEAVEQDNRKKSMMDVSMNPDFFNKSYEEMKKVVFIGSKASLQAIIDGNKEFKFTVDGTEYTAKVKNKFNNSFEIIGVDDKHSRGE